MTRSARHRAADRSRTDASSAINPGAMSPMGDALTRLPPSVARLRMGREAKTESIFKSAALPAAERGIRPVGTQGFFDPRERRRRAEGPPGIGTLDAQ